MRGTIPYLTVQETGRLDCAMTNCVARPHLLKSYKGMQSPAYNNYPYADKDNFAALRKVIARGIDLRDF